MASIIITAGPREGDFYPLGHRTTVIGRDEAVPIQVVDERVSRRHLQIRYEPEKGYVALDMRSSNGVFINGRRITVETLLADSDEIQVGDTKMMFTVSDFPDKQSAMAHFKKAGQKHRSTLMQ
jgi:pSer/pThr/pTyr-binding forkhead associated (FHA) protein